MEIFTTTFLIGLLAATFRVATPLIFATIGEVFTERAGILNLGIEGIMFLGAFVGFAVAATAAGAGLVGYLWLGLAAAIVSGLVMSLLMGFLSVTLGVNQHVAGLGITLLCTGLALFGFRLVFGEQAVLPSIDPFVQLDLAAENPLLGPLLQQYWLTYAAFFVVAPLGWWLLYRTSFGLEVRTVGENPEAADAAGVNVFRTRYLALLIGGALMSVGGAFLSLAQLGAFTPGIIAGRGWVCIALVVFGSWRPGKALIGAILFAAFDAYQIRLQQLSGGIVPYQIFLMLPYALSILALIVVARRATYPKALMIPYQKGER